MILHGNSGPPLVSRPRSHTLSSFPPVRRFARFATPCNGADQGG